MNIIELSESEYNSILENREDIILSESIESICEDSSESSIIKRLIKELGRAVTDFLKGIGLFILANILFVVLLLSYHAVSSKFNTANREKFIEYLKKNPEAKKALKKILENCQKFLIDNFPQKYKKYIINKRDKINVIDILRKQPEQSSVNDISIVAFSIDIDAIFKSIYGKSIFDYLEEHIDKEYWDDPDTYIEYSEVPEFEKAIEEIHDWIDDINKKVKQIKNCVISFSLYDYECLGFADDYLTIEVSINLHIKDIKNIHLSDEEKELVNKLSK